MSKFSCSPLETFQVGVHGYCSLWDDTARKLAPPFPNVGNTE